MPAIMKIIASFEAQHGDSNTCTQAKDRWPTNRYICRVHAVPRILQCRSFPQTPAALVTVRLPLVPTKCRRIPPIPADYRLFPLNQLTPALCRREILAHSAECRCMPSTAAYYRSIPTNAEGYRQSTLVPVKCRSMLLFTAESRRIPPKSAHCRTATRYQTLPLNAVLYR